MKTVSTAFLFGLLFSIGLGISGMMDPVKVQGFLDLTGRWDPSLALVMGGALLVTFFAFPWITSKQTLSRLGNPFDLPRNTTIDLPLIGGAFLFGIGWAISGLCPGPALANVAGLHSGVLLYLAMMFVGFWMHRRLFKV